MGIKSKDSPFISFNCADYANNPQLLLGQLFGVKKGAYTGADFDKVGLLDETLWYDDDVDWLLRAKELGLSGYSGLNKEKLITELRNH